MLRRGKVDVSLHRLKKVREQDVVLELDVVLEQDGELAGLVGDQCTSTVTLKTQVRITFLEMDSTKK